MSSPEQSLSLQDRLRQSLKPLGGELRIDGFIRLVARERARQAAHQKASKTAPVSPARPEPEAKVAPAPQPAAVAPKGADLEDEVKAFMERDEVQEAPGDEVSEFMDFMGGPGFDPDDTGD